MTGWGELFNESNTFKFEYDRSKSIDATINGNSLLLIPREIPTETKESDAGMDGDPCGGAETLWHLPILANNKLLAISIYPTCLKLSGMCHRGFFKNLRWTKSP